MPVITFEITKLTKEQKKKIVEDFTDTASKVTGLPHESFYIFLKENDLRNVAVGGKLLDEN